VKNEDNKPICNVNLGYITYIMFYNIILYLAGNLLTVFIYNFIVVSNEDNSIVQLMEYYFKINLKCRKGTYYYQDISKIMQPVYNNRIGNVNNSYLFHQISIHFLNLK